MKNRNGKSLIEMLVVMAIMSVVMGITIKTTIIMMRADADSGQSTLSSTNLNRLAHRFRRDVHAATAAELIATADNAPKTLKLSMPDNVVTEYRPLNDRIVRLVRKGETPQSRDAFPLLRGENRFELTTDQSTVVSLVHIRNTQQNSGKSPNTPGRREIRIEAVQGKNHRFANTKN